MRFNWFGLDGRKSLPARGPRWFVSRGANFLYVSLGGMAAVTVPFFWHRGFIESRGFDRGWNAGYEAGWQSARRQAGDQP